MPSVKYSAQSLADLKRLHDFWAQQDPEVARRAITVIQDALQKIAVMPERFRPVEGKMYHREAIIDFGASGYIARFRHMPNGEITIARIKHLTRRQIPPLPHRQLTQLDAANAHPLQAHHGQAHQFAHAPDLPLFALAQHKAQLLGVLPVDFGGLQGLAFQRQAVA
jgi:plasmid stabilization system protein ParE